MRKYTGKVSASTVLVMGLFATKYLKGLSHKNEASMYIEEGCVPGPQGLRIVKPYKIRIFQPIGGENRGLTLLYRYVGVNLVGRMHAFPL